MKKLKFLFFALIAFVASSVAQTPQKLTAVIKTPTVQCQECKERIEKYLGHEEGIVKVNEDYKRKICTVTYLTDRTNIENIKTLIANAGYDADDITAEPDSYKRLPPCCKKPEDGGGHGKQP